MSQLYVTCPVTGERMERFTKEHAQKLGFPSLSKYRKAYNLDYLTVYQRSRNHLKRLYNVDFKRWVVGYRNSDGEMRYVTKIYEPGTTSTARAASRFPLGDSNFNAHFAGVHPLAIFAFGTHARYFGFDVDSKEQAPTHTLKIVQTLVAEGFSRHDIHVSFSGGKGYHVELFTAQHLSFADWVTFGRYIIDKAGLTGEPIEFRPTSNNSHALKMPLTKHPKTGRFAGYCDNQTLEVLDEQQSHDYLATIQQIDVDPVLAVIDRAKTAKTATKPAAKPDKPKQKAVRVREVGLFKTTAEKKETAVKLLSEGLPGTGTRWKAMRNVLIPYLKIEQGCDERETREILVNFCRREHEAGRITTPLDKCEREIDDLIKNYYPLVDGVYSNVREVEITRNEVEWVAGVIEQDGSRTARDLLWALLLLKKAYANKKGEFFAARATVQKLLAKPRKISPVTIQKSRDWLAENGYIEFTVPDNSFRERRATTYKLLNEEATETEILGQVQFDEELDSRALLKEVTKHLYASPELKKLKLS